MLSAFLCASPPRARCAEPSEIIKASGVRGGLAVVVGFEDAGVLAKLGSAGPFLVCGLDADAEKVSTARSALLKAGVHGPVTVAGLTGGGLPFVDNTVNLFVLGPRDVQVATREIYRSLAPGGAVVEVAASGLKVTPKPRPDNIDHWTHYLYDASNNAVSKDTVVAPPRGLHWKCGPRYARSHEHFGSVSAMVSGGGRIFYVHDAGPISSVFLPPKWELVARDAFSGVGLWKQPIDNWESQLRAFRSGPPEIGRRLVFGAGRLYAALGYGRPVAVFDPATGTKLSTLSASAGARELLHADGRLYVLADDMTAQDHDKRKEWFNKTARTVRGYQFPREPIPMYGKQRIAAFDGESGKQLWCNKDGRAGGEIMPATLAVAGGKVCFQTTDNVVCLDAKTGKELWRARRPVAVSRLSWATPTLVIRDGVVISGDRMPEKNIGDKPEKGSRWIMDNRHQMQKQPGEIIALSLADGKELWRAPAFENYTIPMDIFVIDGVVWTGDIRSKNFPGFTTGRKLKTGKVATELPHNGKFYSLQMGHNRCYRNKATCRFLILGRDGIEFVDPVNKTGSGCWWVRGTCQYGVMPANGLIYAPVHSCACHPQEKLNGFNTLSPVSAAPEKGEGEPARLTKGPAYGAKASKAAANPADWPTYRRDPRRSGYQDVDAPKDLKPVWTAEYSPPLTPPVVAGQTVYVAETDRHTVRAVAAADGKEKWRFVADGRIDSPPTIHRGLCLFGTRNGLVYCLAAENGEVVWRFRAAARNRMLFSYGQLESVWPVHGSVLVDGGAVYFAAGRTSHLDGGIRLWALDARTGKPLNSATVTLEADAKGDGIIKARALPDILSLQDGSVYMRDLRLDRKLAHQKQAVRHLYAPGGFLDDSWWHRTYWVFGTHMMSGYGGWPRVGNVTPAGRLLVYDGGEMIYGYGRMAYRAGAGHVRPDATKDYKIFAELRSPKARAAENKGKRRSRRGGRRSFTWSKPLPFIARAMVLCRDAVLVAGGKGLPHTAAGHGPGMFRIVSRKAGQTLAECNLPATPLLDGMALAGPSVFISTNNGKLICLK